jgi:hypothetical protein
MFWRVSEIGKLMVFQRGNRVGAVSPLGRKGESDVWRVSERELLCFEGLLGLFCGGVIVFLVALVVSPLGRKGESVWFFGGEVIGFPTWKSCGVVLFLCGF